MAAVPSRPAGSRTRHKKRFSVSRLSSDTTATLPEYRQATSPIWNSPVPDDEPPDYPDSADEADEENDEYLPLSPPLSPRRKRFARLTSKRNLPYHGAASQSDTFLDSLLERSVNALELSNALLHSSMTAQSSLTNVFDVDQSSDRMLDARARGLSQRIRKNKNVQERWMDDLDDLTKDVEDFMDDGNVSHSLPSSSPIMRRQWKERKASLELRETKRDGGRLVSNATTRNLSSPPPRALTQYVSIRAEQGDVLEATSDPSHIFLPSTIGLRSSSHVSDFSPPPFIPSSSPESSPITPSLVRRHSGSPSPHFTYVLSIHSVLSCLINRFARYPDVTDLQDHPHPLADRNHALVPALGPLPNLHQILPKSYLVPCRPRLKSCLRSPIPRLRTVLSHSELSSRFGKFWLNNLHLRRNPLQLDLLLNRHTLSHRARRPLPPSQVHPLPPPAFLDYTRKDPILRLRAPRHPLACLP